MTTLSIIVIVVAFSFVSTLSYQMGWNDRGSGTPPNPPLPPGTVFGLLEATAEPVAELLE